MESPSFSQPLYLTDKQWKEYIAAVEQLVEQRRQAGALLSTFDVLAGAMLLFAISDTMNKLPARWVFAAVSPGLLPQGVLERALVLGQEVDNLSDARHELVLLTDEIQKLRSQLADIRGRFGNLAERTSALRQDAAPKVPAE